MRLTIISIVIIAFVISCENKSNRELKNYKSEKLELKANSISENLLTPTKIFKNRGHLITYDKSSSSSLFKIFDLESLNHKYSFGVVGNGPSEFSGIDEQSIYNTEGGFEVLDAFTIKEINLYEDSIAVNPVKRLGFSSTPINGLRKLNDNLYSTFTEFGEDNQYEFQLVNIKDGNIEKKYGEFPKYQRELDATSKFMVYNKSVASNIVNGMMISFYLYHPEFKIFNENGELHRHIKFGENSPFDFTKHINENNVIFAEPYAGKDFIYVLYINKPKSYVEEHFENYAPELIVFDWEGNLHKKYQLDAPITSFTIDEESNTFYGISFFEMNKIYTAHLDDSEENSNENVAFTSYSSKYYSFDIYEGWYFSNNQNPIQNPADTLYEDEDYFYNEVFLSLPRNKKRNRVSSAVIMIEFKTPKKSNEEASIDNLLLGNVFDNYSRNDTIIGGRKMIHEYYESNNVLPNKKKSFVYSNNFIWQENNKYIRFTINLDKTNHNKYRAGIDKMLKSFDVKKTQL